jgi:hypothetical protein
MKSNFIAYEKLHKYRQLEENRRSTKNASTSLAQTSFIHLSLKENEQLINESITVLDSQKVSNFQNVGEGKLVILTL